MNEELLFKVGILALSMQFLGCTRSEVSFSSDVQPIFDNHCIECHDSSSGEGVVASGFSVYDYASVMKGTELGIVVIPGSSKVDVELSTPGTIVTTKLIGITSGIGDGYFERL